MSKTITEQVAKAKILASGLRRHLDLLKGKGVDENYIQQLEDDSEKLQVCDDELEKIKADIHERIKAMNMKLVALKDKMLVARKTVKTNFSQETWIQFGVTDKRL